MPYGPNGELVCGCNLCTPRRLQTEEAGQTERLRSLAEQLQEYADPVPAAPPNDEDEDEELVCVSAPDMVSFEEIFSRMRTSSPTTTIRVPLNMWEWGPEEPTPVTPEPAPVARTPRYRCDYGCYRTYPEDQMRNLPRWGWVCNICTTGPEPRFWHCVPCDVWSYMNDRCRECRRTRCHMCAATDEYMSITGEGNVVCRQCQRASCWECEECGSVWPNSRTECGGYHRDDEDNGDLVHSYSYRPKPKFRGEGPLYLGAEIEVEIADEHDEYRSAEKTIAVFGDLAYLKEDGSIDGGFEIVTHPMTYEWALENFPWDGFGRLRDQAGLRHRRSCGLHIHVSKKGFNSESHAYRWMKFIHRNKRQVRLFARRECDEYASFTDRGRRDVKHYVKGGSGERYQAINPNNRHTFEMRMFASTTYKTQLKAALAFAASTVEYTRMLDANAIIARKAWSWEAFVGWVAHEDQRVLYRPLLLELRRLNLS